MDLWQEEDCAAWHEALEKYERVVEAQGVRGLLDLDKWYREQLPGILLARDPVFAKLDELERVTSWKMKRGVWRERNRQLVAGNPPAEVENLTVEAFKLVPEPKKPIAIISKLAGVGPATASALLGAYDPATYPFFDELVAEQIPGLGEVAFTAAYYARYSEKLRERAATLREVCSHGGLTAQDVSHALWANSGGKIARA